MLRCLQTRAMLGSRIVACYFCTLHPLQGDLGTGALFLTRHHKLNGDWPPARAPSTHL